MAIALSGSLILSGSIIVSGSITSTGTVIMSGSIASASYATNAELLDGLDSTAFATTGAYSATSASLYATSASLSATSGSLSTTSGSLSATSGSLSATSGSLSTASGSFNTRVSALEVTGSALSSSLLTVSGSGYATSGSLNTRVSALEATGSALSSSLLTVSGSGYATSASLSAASGSFNTRVASLETYSTNLTAKTASFATTGSNTFIGTQVVSGSILQSGSFTSTGTLTAQTLVIQTITSSVVYSSGSNVFGNDIGNSQRFTGSVLITGSLTIAGASSATSYNGATIFGSTIACSPIGCFATSCATSFIGGTMSGTTIYGSTAVCSPVGKFTTCLDLGGALNGTSAIFSSGLIVSNTADVYPEFKTSAADADAFLGFSNTGDGNNAWSIGRRNTGEFWISNYTGNFNSGTRTQPLTIASTGAATFSSSVTAGTQFIGSNTTTDPTVGITTATVYALNGPSSNNTFGIGIGAIRNSAYDMWFQTGAVNGGGYRWYIGTSEKMTMSSTGNVGIGTSSPLNKLDIVQVGSNNAVAGVGLKIVSDAGNPASIALSQIGRGTVTIGMAAAGAAPADFVLGTDVTGNIIFKQGLTGTYGTDLTTGTERMRITSNGGLNLGTSTGNSITKLNVQADATRFIAFEAIAASGNKSVYIRAVDTGIHMISSNYISSSPYLPLALSARENTSDLYLAINGNIGIGTSSPSGLLQVGVANSGIYIDTTLQYTPKIKAAGTISDIQIESVGSGGNVYLTAPGATSLITLSTAGSERMRITSGGTVGIGPCSPQRQFVISNGGAAGMELSSSTASTTIISYNRATSTWLPLILQEGTGNVLIGTTCDAGYKLNVNGTLNVASSLNVASTISAGGTISTSGNLNSTTQGLLNSAGNYAKMVHKVQGASGAFSNVIVCASLNGAGGWGYIINQGGTGGGAFQAGGGYTNGTGNFSHNIGAGCGFTVSSVVGDVIRFVGPGGTHPFVSIQMFGSLNQSFDDTNICIYYV